jgi:hypothetical protein
MRQRKSTVDPQGSSRTAVPEEWTGRRGGNGKPTYEQISQRAYEIYLARGSAGDALADWLQAERELGTQG